MSDEIKKGINFNDDYDEIVQEENGTNEDDSGEE